MKELRFDIDWLVEHDVDPVLAQTAANLRITLDNICLTENVDIWSESKSEKVLVSVYPLAVWVASSWWRLLYEVLPTQFGARPSQDWRLSHEMAAANHGYVWPLIMFSTDRTDMNIWAEAFPADAGQSVRYLNGLDTIASVAMPSFETACRKLIEQVLERLDTEGCTDSDLAHLWSLILADMDNLPERRKRRIEAQFGYDPEDCPEALLGALVDIEDEMGEDVLAELAAVRTWPGGDRAQSIRELFKAPGIEAQPELPRLPVISKPAEPWQQAKADAAALRRQINAGDGAVKNSVLADLLGVDIATLEEPPEFGHRPAAIAGRIDARRFRFVPHKRHPVARRFEWARLIGGCTDSIVRDGNEWLASTNAKTFRQKYQRAFAAEFLCPIEHLANFIDGDFSEGKIEDAAAVFNVSDQTVSLQLKNNRFLPWHDTDYGSPYSLVG